MTFARMYGLAGVSLATGLIDWESDTVQAALLDSSYVPNQDTHQFVSHLSGELSGGGYARASVLNRVANYDAPTNTTIFACDDIEFAALTSPDIRFCAIFSWTGVAATSPLIGYLDFETPRVAAAEIVRIPVVSSLGVGGLLVQ